MTQTQLANKIKELPPDLIKQVNDFVDLLISKTKKAKKEKKPKRGGYGSMKGKIIMGDDFDAPLEEFKDYM